MSAVYPKAKEAFITGVINLSSNTIKAAVVNATDTPYNAAHQFRIDVGGGTVLHYLSTTDQTLGSKSVTNGAFGAAASSFTVALDGSKVVNGIYLYKDNGSSATDVLIAYYDGFSVTPNGGAIPVNWPTSAPYLFTL